MFQMPIQMAVLYRIFHQVVCFIKAVLILVNAILNIDLNFVESLNGKKKGLMLIDEDPKISPDHDKVSHLETYKLFLAHLETLRTSNQSAIAHSKTENNIVSYTSIHKAYDDSDYGTRFITSKNSITIL